MQHDQNLPPQSLESEMSILGAVFIDNNALDRVFEFITIEDFYRESHRKIFTSMVRLSDMNEPCDLVTMTEALKRSGHLEEVGGAAYLLLLVDYVPTAANVAYYCKIVADKALERRLLTCAQSVEIMVRQGKPASEVIETLESAITRIATPQKQEAVHAKELTKESISRLKERNKRGGSLQGMSWGIAKLDEATTGMQRGDLIIIAGRPSMGKSALAGNILRCVGESGLCGQLQSLEMSRVDCMDKIIADVGNIKYHHLRTGKLFDNEWAKHAHASNQISQWNLYIDDTASITLAQIKSKAKKQKRSGLDVLVIDYLQLIQVSGRENRTQAIGEISRGLKLLARELDIAVILLSQLNRSVDGRPDKRPLMSDLRDSGEIEQDADVILFPFRQSAYCPKCKDRVNDDGHNLIEHQALAELIIEKQRNGERNISIPLVWMGEYQRFEGMPAACIDLD